MRISYKTAGINDALAVLGLTKTAGFGSGLMQAAERYAPHALAGAALGAGTGALTAGEGNRTTGALTGAVAGGLAGGVGHHMTSARAPSLSKTLTAPTAGALAGAGQGAFVNYRAHLSPEERLKMDNKLNDINTTLLLM